MSGAIRRSLRHLRSSSPARSASLSSTPSSQSRHKKREKLVNYLGQWVKPKEVPILQAVAAVVSSGLNEHGDPNLSFNAAALDHHVSATTVRRRYRGGSSHVSASTSQMHVSPIQERVIKEHIDECQARGIPLAPKDVKEAASIISGQTCGDSWYRGFRERNPDVVGKISKCLEAPRAQALNPANTAKYFDMLQSLVREYNISTPNIYNMDEKGVQLGKGGNSYVLVDQNIKTVSSIENGNRQNVTIIECVSANGTALPPCVIFKGVRADLECVRDNPCGASVSWSPKGWTVQELSYEWLVNDFDKHTRNKAQNGQYRLLILDGHNSHLTYKFCLYARTNRIIVLCLPPHTTHVLQPCDVGVFGPLASSWSAQIRLTSHAMIHITSHNFLHYYAIAWATSVVSRTILSSFRSSGISPFNPTVIPASAFETAKLTTTQAAPTVSTAVPDLLMFVPAQGPVIDYTPSWSSDAVTPKDITADIPSVQPIQYSAVSPPSPPHASAPIADWIHYGKASSDYMRQAGDIMSA